MTDEIELTREALIRLVARVRCGDFGSEKETDHALALFQANVPHPRAIGLITHWHHEFTTKPTDAEIVDRALSYRAIEL